MIMRSLACWRILRAWDRFPVLPDRMCAGRVLAGVLMKNSTVCRQDADHRFDDG